MKTILALIVERVARRLDSAAKELEREHSGQWYPIDSVGARWLKLASQLRDLARQLRAGVHP